MTKTRPIILALIFLASAVFVYGLDRDSKTELPRSLADFPKRIGKWKAINSQSMGEDIEEVLGVDAYLLRDYQGANGDLINLYVSYFSYTDRTKGYHSPLNCMPGSGWNIADTEPVSLNLLESAQQVTLNKLTLQNGLKKQLSLYWYQCRGRILHNEYIERIYRVLDSIFKNRTDGAFIRLIASSSTQGVEQDTAMLKGFAAELIPILKKYLPNSH